MLRGTEKAAAVLSLLGDELAHKILSNLPEQVAVSIMDASEHLKTPTRADLIEAVSEFNGFMAAQVQAHAEKEEAAATAARTAAEIAKLPPLERIVGASPEVLASALKDERPEISAYVLSHLPVEKIYETLTMLGDQKEHVESRLLTIKDVPIAKELEEKILKNISERIT